MQAQASQSDLCILGNLASFTAAVAVITVEASVSFKVVEEKEEVNSFARSVASQ